jgi:hypothetical protein
MPPAQRRWGEVSLPRTKIPVYLLRMGRECWSQVSLSFHGCSSASMSVTRADVKSTAFTLFTALVRNDLRCAEVNPANQASWTGSRGSKPYLRH